MSRHVRSRLSLQARKLGCDPVTAVSGDRRHGIAPCRCVYRTEISVLRLLKNRELDAQLVEVGRVLELSQTRQ
jgi:hypothetical protein